MQADGSDPTAEYVESLVGEQGEVVTALHEALTVCAVAKAVFGTMPKPEGLPAGLMTPRTPAALGSRLQ